MVRTCRGLNRGPSGPSRSVPDSDSGESVSGEQQRDMYPQLLLTLVTAQPRQLSSASSVS